MFFTGQGTYCHFISSTPRLLGTKGSPLSSISLNGCFLSLFSKDREKAVEVDEQIASTSPALATVCETYGQNDGQTMFAAHEV